jgi:hypothetical protein
MPQMSKRVWYLNDGKYRFQTEKALYKDYRNGGDRVAGFRRGDLDRDALNGRR